MAEFEDIHTICMLGLDVSAILCPFQNNVHVTDNCPDLHDFYSTFSAWEELLRSIRYVTVLVCGDNAENFSLLGCQNLSRNMYSKQLQVVR